MNRTTKILLAAAGIIVLSYPGIAWVTGIVIESRMQHAEQQGLEQVPYFTLIKSEYHRGVYRSTEIATYGFHIPVKPGMQGAGAPPPPAVTITISSDIRHGPFPGLHAPALAIVDSTIVGPPALQQELSAALGSKPLLRIHSTIGLSGRTSGNVTSPAFSLRLPDGSTLAWGGLTATGSSSRNQTAWQGQLSVPRLAYAGAQGRFEVTGIEYTGSEQKAFGGLYLGTGTFTVERVDGSSQHSGDYSMERISLTTHSQPTGDLFDLRVDVAMDAASFAAVQLKNVVYSESLEHVDGPALASMTQAIRAAQRQAVNQAQLQAALVSAVRQYGADLLLHDPVVDLRQVSFAMPEGSFLLSARIRAPGLSRADLQWPAAILALRTHAEVTSDLRIDNGLLQKLLAMAGPNARIGAQLTSFEQQGYLTAGTTAVTTHVDYSGGSLSLNGHPFPPAAPVN